MSFKESDCFIYIIKFVDLELFIVFLWYPLNAQGGGLSFLILVIFIFSLFVLVSLARSLSILLIFQRTSSCISSILFLLYLLWCFPLQSLLISSSCFPDFWTGCIIYNYFLLNGRIYTYEFYSGKCFCWKPQVVIVDVFIIITFWMVYNFRISFLLCTRAKGVQFFPGDGILIS